MKIEIKGLSKEFTKNGQPSVSVLSDLDLTVARGEFLSLAGPSGCGKTTLLEIVAGLQQPTSGQVLIDNMPVTGRKNRPAIVFQQYGLFPWLSVQHNVEFGLKMNGTDRKKRRRLSDKYIKMVHLDGYAHYYPHELSGGMQQRVALARSLATEPDVLLLDEPFAALDALTKEKCAQELLGIWRETGLTIIYVTHDVSEAVLMSDRIVILSRGGGAIRRVFDVPLPRPRTMETKLEETFRRLEHQARTALDLDLCPQSDLQR